MMIKVIAADSHPIVTVGIEQVLSRCENVELIGTAHDSEEVLDLAEKKGCDVLVTDPHAIQIKSGPCRSLIPVIQSRYPRLGIVAHACIENPAQLATMTRLGIAAVLHRIDTVGHLVDAIKAAHFNAHYFSPSLLRKGGSAACLSDPERALTPRESEILAHFVSGKTVCEIARALHRSKQTISAHKMRGMVKLGVCNDAELFRLAFQDGFLSFCLSCQGG
ncbi:response regulator transcription factor [Paraburkholderia azotifigens]|uniref:response regulator transcription factor n=1 Tax=Paraburkholderia azotifigens TaxID=2057004 RepID=UPI0031803C08